MLNHHGSPLWAAFFLFVVCSAATADTGDVLAQLGTSAVSVQEFEAAVRSAPPDQRQAILDDRARVEQMLEVILVRRSILEQGELNRYLDATDEQQLRRQAYLRTLGADYLSELLSQVPAIDFVAASRSIYQAEAERFRSEPTVTASHILIANDDRSDAEAKSLAEELHRRVIESPGSFDQWVMEYSDDPMKHRNRGRYERFPRGRMVAPFDAWAFAPHQPGDISELVETRFGYHLIRFEQSHPARELAFAEVADQLEAEARRNYYIGKRSELLAAHDNDLTALGRAAEEAGFGQDPITQAAIGFDVEEAVLQAYQKAFLAAEVGDTAPLEQLAYEQYLVNQQAYAAGERASLRVVYYADALPDELSAAMDSCDFDVLGNVDDGRVETKIVNAELTQLDADLLAALEALRESDCRFFIASNGDQGQALVELISLRPAGIKSFDEVKTALVQPLQVNRQRQRWETHLDAFRNLASRLDEDVLIDTIASLRGRSDLTSDD